MIATQLIHLNHTHSCKLHFAMQTLWGLNEIYGSHFTKFSIDLYVYVLVELSLCRLYLIVLLQKKT